MMRFTSSLSSSYLRRKSWMYLFWVRGNFAKGKMGELNFSVYNLCTSGAFSWGCDYSIAGWPSVAAAPASALLASTFDLDLLLFFAGTLSSLLTTFSDEDFLSTFFGFKTFFVLAYSASVASLFFFVDAKLASWILPKKLVCIISWLGFTKRSYEGP